MKNKWFFLALIGLLLILIDSQLLNLIHVFISAKIMISSHFFLLGLILFSKRMSYLHMLIGSVSLGIIYDSYFRDNIGFSYLLYALYAVLAKLFMDKIASELYSVVILQLIMIFTHKLFYYYQFYSDVVMAEFLLWNLIPSLIFNLLVTVILYPLFDKILKSNRYSIVTNA